MLRFRLSLAFLLARCFSFSFMQTESGQGETSDRDDEDRKLWQGLPAGGTIGVGGDLASSAPELELFVEASLSILRDNLLFARCAAMDSRRFMPTMALPFDPSAWIGTLLAPGVQNCDKSRVGSRTTGM